jgi:hypothetical protein
LAVLFIGTILASVLTGRRAQRPGNLTGIALGLLAYSLVRGTFFFVFDPPEPLLFSSSVTLAHMLMFGMLFAAANFPGKRTVLAAFAVLLFATNQAFIIGW